MTVEAYDKVDFAIIERKTGDVVLTVSDHLDWGENEGEHLFVLQKKLNYYLEFIESGQIYENVPRAAGRKIIIQVMGKFPLSEEANKFYRLAGKALEEYGHFLRLCQLQPKDGQLTMSLDNLEVVDTAGTERDSGTIVLTIFDGWNWDDQMRHLSALQAKFNSYFRFVESGQIYENYPSAAGKCCGWTSYSDTRSPAWHSRFSRRRLQLLLN